jgi:hypothetical protein
MTEAEPEKLCALQAIGKCYPPKRAYELQEKLREHIFGKGKRKLGQCVSGWNGGSDYETVHKTLKKLNI